MLIFIQTTEDELKHWVFFCDSNGQERIFPYPPA